VKSHVPVVFVLALLGGCSRSTTSLIEQRPPNLVDATAAPVIFVDTIGAVRDCVIENFADDEGNEGEGTNEPSHVRVYRITGDVSAELRSDGDFLLGFESNSGVTAAGLDVDAFKFKDVPTPWSMSIPFVTGPGTDGCMAGVYRVNHGSDYSMTIKFEEDKYCVRGLTNFVSDEENDCYGPDSGTRVGPWADWEARRAAVARGEP
jgi:hypothetical protein